MVVESTVFYFSHDFLTLEPIDGIMKRLQC